MTGAILRLREVGKNYGRRPVFRNVSLSLAASEALGIIGPNGAGKTTLLRIVLGLLQPSSGAVELDGEPPSQMVARVTVGYFGGVATLPPGVRANRWVNWFGPDAAREVPERRRVGVLSRGTRQLVGLRAVLGLGDVRMFVLDEPWEGLDPDGSRWLSASLRKRQARGAAVIVTSHRLFDLAGVCDRYAFLARGSLTCVSAGDLAPDGPVTGERLLAAFDTFRDGMS